MKYKFIFVLFLCYLKSSELAKQLIKLDNGWNIAYPCKDNNKVTMLIDNDEVKKSEFYYILSIQGISTYSDKVILRRESDTNMNGVDYIEDKYDFLPGQMSFSTELKGHQGRLPKLKSITIDGINYCKEPDNPVYIITPSQSGSAATNRNKYPITTTSTNADIDLRLSSKSVTPAAAESSVKSAFSNPSVLSEGPNPAAKGTVKVLSNTIYPKEGECGIRKIQHTGLIVRGYESKPGDWPWHAALYKLEKTYIKYICGGTLISKIVVLTAAHCVTESGVPIITDILNVILGKYNLFGGNETPQDKKVFRIIVNKNFEQNILKNDIALLKLSTEAIFNDYVQPACIWRDEYYLKLTSTNIFGMMAGWGFDHTQSLSFVLQQTQLPKIPDKTCLTSNPTFFGRALNEFNFCAGYRNGTSACNGDSGGGYHIFIPDNPHDTTSNEGKWYVHGIVSLAVSLRSQPVCDPNHYVLFTDVGKFTSWIDEQMYQN